MAMYALRRRLPLSLISWPPVGQGALFMLTTGFLPRSDTSSTSSIAVLSAYSVIFLFVLVMSTELAKHGVYLSISFVSLFILTQTTRFPVFETSSGITAMDPTLLTLGAFVRCLIELMLITWLLMKLVEDSQTNGRRVALGLVLLTAAHGVLASWEVPLLNGDLALTTATAQAIQWMILIGIQYGMAIGLAKMRQAWIRIDSSDTETSMSLNADAHSALSGAATTIPPRTRPTHRRRPRKRLNRDPR